MRTDLRWGILGTGAIAKKFAQGLPMCKHGELVSVGSRSLDTAEKFASEFGGKAAASYEAVLDDPNVEAVYISLPHHLHCEWTIKCAEAGKHILCEKPFALTAEEAKTALDKVKDANVFFMEAFMYRMHTQTITLRQLLQDRVIGTPRMMHGEFGYVSQRGLDTFRFDGSVGGGALMDVGCYPVSLARFVAGEEPSRVTYSADLVDSPVTLSGEPAKYDSYGIGEMVFPSGFRATFGCAVHVQMNNWATIYGDLGRIHITDPWFCVGPMFVQLNGRDPEQIKFNHPPHLWGNQSVVVAQLLDQKSAPFMSWRDTYGNTAVLEAMRKHAGLT
jgi:predicted dehydrogenase